MDPDAVAKAFVGHYYNLFDSNRANLAGLYQEGSMLTFEGEKIQGVQNIVGKLTSLPFQQCKHNISTVDCQPSGPAGGMLVFVSGSLQLPGEQHQLKFSQMFHLMVLSTNFLSLLFVEVELVSSLCTIARFQSLSFSTSILDPTRPRAAQRLIYSLLWLSTPLLTTDFFHQWESSSGMN